MKPKSLKTELGFGAYSFAPSSTRGKKQIRTGPHLDLVATFHQERTAALLSFLGAIGKEQLHVRIEAGDLEPWQGYAYLGKWSAVPPADENEHRTYHLPLKVVADDSGPLTALARLIGEMDDAKLKTATVKLVQHQPTLEPDEGKE